MNLSVETSTIKIIPSLHPLIVPIADLHEDPSNARKGHAIDRIAASLKQYGQRKPIVVNRLQGNKVEAGNGTLQAAKSLGWTEIAAVFVEDDAATAAAFGIADNRVAEFSSWDADILADLMPTLEGLTTGFTDSELKAILPQRVNEGDTEPQIDKAEELRVKWGVESGQMWRLGEHRIICGDCTDASVVARVMEGEKAVLMVTDPPYGVEYEGIFNDSPEQLVPLLDKAFEQANSVLAEGAVYYICFPDAHSYEFAGAIRRAGWKQGRPAVVLWLKDTPVMGRGDYNSQFEQMFYGWKGAGHYFAKLIWTNVWEFPRPKVADGHPTMKPVGLFENAIQNSSRNEDEVYEPFSGSGTTLIACENLGRKCRAVEISPGYVAVAIERWAQHTGREPELVS